MPCASVVRFETPPVSTNLMRVSTRSWLKAKERTLAQSEVIEARESLKSPIRSTRDQRTGTKGKVAGTNNSSQSRLQDAAVKGLLSRGVACPASYAAAKKDTCRRSAPGIQHRRLALRVLVSSASVLDA